MPARMKILLLLYWLLIVHIRVQVVISRWGRGGLWRGLWRGALKRREAGETWV
jgi:hypothetical protein